MQPNQNKDTLDVHNKDISEVVKEFLQRKAEQDQRIEATLERMRRRVERLDRGR